MIVVPFPELPKNYSNDMGVWLDQNVPNPPLSEPQRWGLVYDSEGVEVRIRICFANEQDAALYLLRWG